MANEYEVYETEDGYRREDTWVAEINQEGEARGVTSKLPFQMSTVQKDLLWEPAWSMNQTLKRRVYKLGIPSEPEVAAPKEDEPPFGTPSLPWVAFRLKSRPGPSQRVSVVFKSLKQFMDDEAQSLAFIDEVEGPYILEYTINENWSGWIELGEIG